jgi:hypothetical protein
MIKHLLNGIAIGFLVASLFVTPAHAFINAAGGNPYSNTPTQPPIAATYGFNTLTLWDDFATTGGFDLNATYNPGYTWYMRAFQFAGAQSGQQLTVPGNSVSTTNSILTINTTTTGPSPYGGWMGTTGYVGASANPQLVGNAFKNGGYFEASVAFDPSNIPSWPGNPTPHGMAFWLQDNAVGLATSLNQNTGLPGIEFDIFEYYIPQGNVDWGSFEWTAYNAATSQGSHIYSVSGPTNFHKYGMLWVPVSKNSGTGLVRFYLDGVQNGSTITYTSSSPLYAADTSTLGLNLMIGSMPGWPMLIDYVMVWQTQSSDFAPVL